MVVIVYREYWEKKTHQGTFIHSPELYMAHSDLLAIPQIHGTGNFLEDSGLLFRLKGSSPMTHFLTSFTSLLRCHLLRRPFLVPLPKRSALFTLYLLSLLFSLFLF